MPRSVVTPRRRRYAVALALSRIPTRRRGAGPGRRRRAARGSQRSPTGEIPAARPGCSHLPRRERASSARAAAAGDRGRRRRIPLRRGSAHGVGPPDRLDRGQSARPRRPPPGWAARAGEEPTSGSAPFEDPDERRAVAGPSPPGAVGRRVAASPRRPRAGDLTRSCARRPRCGEPSSRAAISSTSTLPRAIDPDNCLSFPTTWSSSDPHSGARAGQRDAGDRAQPQS